MIGYVFNNIPSHVGIVCTGQYGSHKMCTGRVAQFVVILVRSRERTIYAPAPRELISGDMLENRPPLVSQDPDFEGGVYSQDFSAAFGGRIFLYFRRGDPIGFSKA